VSARSGVIVRSYSHNVGLLVVSHQGVMQAALRKTRFNFRPRRPALCKKSAIVFYVVKSVDVAVHIYGLPVCRLCVRLIRTNHRDINRRVTRSRPAAGLALQDILVRCIDEKTKCLFSAPSTRSAFVAFCEFAPCKWTYHIRLYTKMYKKYWLLVRKPVDV